MPRARHWRLRARLGRSDASAVPSAAPQLDDSLVLPNTTLPAFHPQGTYVDKKCPFTGNVSIRGRILKGVVVSTKMNRTVVIRRDYLQYVSKYRRYEKRHKTLSAHCSPAFLVKDGDVVTVGQCRCVLKLLGRRRRC
jgi:ribosomal protein uS17